MSEPNHDEVVPREGYKVIFGDNVQTDLLLLLHADRRVYSATELVERLDHDRDAIAEEIRNLAQFNVIECPQYGMYRFTHGQVGQHLHEMIDLMSEKTRELQDLAPLADCVGHTTSR